MRYWLILLIILVNSELKANDSLLIPKLFQKILYKQQLETDFFKKGSFESFRQYADEPYFKADNNIFFTALIAYTLKNLKPYLTQQELIVADTLINRASKSFNFYKNLHGRLSYNFWPTQPKKIFFPNNFLLSSLSKKLALPDDLDDTGIILSCLNLNDSLAKNAHAEMQEFINGKRNNITNTFSDYANIAAYSTWYGKKMPIDFDFAVHCNILSFVNQYNLEWTKADSATFRLLLNMIDDGYVKSEPKFISPYYATTPILIYHLARFMQTKKMDELELKKPYLIKIALQEIDKSDIFMEKIILQTSLIKLGYYKSVSTIKEDELDKYLYLNEFSFYHGHLFAHLNHDIKRMASNLKATEFRWFCSAFNDVLVLENLILKHRKQHKSD